MIFADWSSLRRHGHAEHATPSALPTVCVDRSNGLFLVAQGSPGALAPIHVQKHTSKLLIQCTDDDCLGAMNNSAFKCPSMECSHLFAPMYSIVQNTPQVTSLGLERLSSKNIISATTSDHLNA